MRFLNDTKKTIKNIKVLFTILFITFELEHELELEFYFAYIHIYAVNKKGVPWRKQGV